MSQRAKLKEPQIYEARFCFCFCVWHHSSRAIIAQLDRESDLGSEGRRFEPC